jgi:hypothetical protein
MASSPGNLPALSSLGGAERFYYRAMGQHAKWSYSRFLLWLTAKRKY